MGTWLVPIRVLSLCTIRLLFCVEKQFFDYMGTRMAYRRREGKYPLILIHGFTASSEIWEPLVDKLDDRFDLIMVDLFGHGDSEMPPIKANGADVHTIISYQASAISELIQSLGFSDFGIIGSSLGGWVSMELAVRHKRPSGLVLIDTAGVVSLDEPDFRNGLSLLVQLYNEQENKLTPFLNKLLEKGENSSTMMSADLLDNADFRVSVIWGTEDPVLRVNYGKEFSARLKNSSFTEIYNAGHTPFTTSPQEVAEIVNSFFG